MRAAAIILILAAGALPGGCYTYKDPTVPATSVGRMQAADARRTAEARCMGRGVRQKSGSDGTSAMDYDCVEPSR